MMDGLFDNDDLGFRYEVISDSSHRHIGLTLRQIYSAKLQTAFDDMAPSVISLYWLGMLSYFEKLSDHPTYHNHNSTSLPFLPVALVHIRMSFNNHTLSGHPTYHFQIPPSSTKDFLYCLLFLKPTYF